MRRAHANMCSLPSPDSPTCPQKFPPTTRNHSPDCTPKHRRAPAASLAQSNLQRAASAIPLTTLPIQGTNLWQTLEISLRILRVTEQRRPAEGGGEHKRESSCRRTVRGHYATQKHGGCQRKGCEFARDTRGKNSSARAPNPT